MGLQKILDKIHKTDLTDSQCRYILNCICIWSESHDKDFDIEKVERGFEIALKAALELDDEKTKSGGN